MSTPVTFSLYEIPASPAGSPGITYVVTHGGVVIFTREYMRHVRLIQNSPYPKHAVAWGGVLNSEGHWIRKSFDFGDAPDIDTRDFVVELLLKVL